MSMNEESSSMPLAEPLIVLTDTGEKVYTFSEITASSESADDFEEVGLINSGKGSLKATGVDPNITVALPQTVFRRKGIPAEEIFPQRIKSGPVKKGEFLTEEESVEGLEIE